MYVLYPILIVVALYFGAALLAPLLPVFIFLMLLHELLNRKKRN